MFLFMCFPRFCLRFLQRFFLRPRRRCLLRSRRRCLLRSGRRFFLRSRRRCLLRSRRRCLLRSRRRCFLRSSRRCFLRFYLRSCLCFLFLRKDLQEQREPRQRHRRSQGRYHRPRDDSRAPARLFGQRGESVCRQRAAGVCPEVRKTRYPRNMPEPPESAGNEAREQQIHGVHAADDRREQKYRSYYRRCPRGLPEEQQRKRAQGSGSVDARGAEHLVLYQFFIYERRDLIADQREYREYHPGEDRDVGAQPEVLRDV